jgi:hypothetical protein
MFQRNAVPPSSEYKKIQSVRDVLGRSPELTKFSPLSTLDLSLYPENGGGTFLRNVNKDIPDHKESHPKRHLQNHRSGNLN